MVAWQQGEKTYSSSMMTSCSMTAPRCARSLMYSSSMSSATEPDDVARGERNNTNIYDATRNHTNQQDPVPQGTEPHEITSTRRLGTNRHFPCPRSPLSVGVYPGCTQALPWRSASRQPVGCIPWGTIPLDVPWCNLHPGRTLEVNGEAAALQPVEQVERHPRLLEAALVAVPPGGARALDALHPGHARALLVRRAQLREDGGGGI